MKGTIYTRGKKKRQGKWQRRDDKEKNESTGKKITEKIEEDRRKKTKITGNTQKKGRKGKKVKIGKTTERVETNCKEYMKKESIYKGRKEIRSRKAGTSMEKTKGSFRKGSKTKEMKRKETIDKLKGKEKGGVGKIVNGRRKKGEGG